MSSNTEEMVRRSSLQWIKVNDIQVSDNAQRELRPGKAAKIAAVLDPDAFGIITVSMRGGKPWVIDGQHRVEAAKIAGYGETLIQCDCFEGLNEAQEAELFLRLNDSLAARAFDKFMIGLTAQRPRELDIARAVESQGLQIGASGARIRCISALLSVYGKTGREGLELTLRLIRDSYGEPAMTSAVVRGMGLVVHRYNGQLAPEMVVSKLAPLRNGVNGLMGLSYQISKKTGRDRAHCVAAAIVDVVNSGKGGKKLPPFWE